MLNEVGTQVFPGNITALQQVRRICQIAGERTDLACRKRIGNGSRVVRVAIEALRQFQRVLDTIQTAGQRPREDKIEIGVGTWYAVLDTDSPSRNVDDVHRASTIIHTPGGVQ